LTEEGLKLIINIRASMNLGLSDLQKSEFTQFKPVRGRQIITYNEIPNPNWIAGGFALCRQAVKVVFFLLSQIPIKIK
jgi:hypothetical protein